MSSYDIRQWNYGLFRFFLGGEGSAHLESATFAVSFQCQCPFKSCPIFTRIMKSSLQYEGKCPTFVCFFTTALITSAAWIWLSCYACSHQFFSGGRTLTSRKKHKAHTLFFRFSSQSLIDQTATNPKRNKIDMLWLSAHTVCNHNFKITPNKTWYSLPSAQLNSLGTFTRKKCHYSYKIRSLQRILLSLPFSHKHGS